jgi:Family of unknown function (DUF6282)
MIGADAPPPSDRALEVVRAAYDLHVHLAPDVVERSAYDDEAARRFAEVGMAGMVLKSHYVPTAERAALVRRLVPEVDTRGSITLNATVGGLNPLAVEIAAREGAAVVWLPTVDAENETAGRVDLPPDANVPVWARLQQDLRRRGFATPPVPVVDAEGRLLPELHDVLRLIAEHDLVLATSHLARDEIFAVVDAASRAGVTRIIVTHPEFPSQNLSARDQVALAERGAMLERCFTTPNTGKVEWDVMVRNIRHCGIAASFLASDLGQKTAPPVEHGLAHFADRLLVEGFTDGEIRTMAVDNTRRLLQVES